MLCSPLSTTTTTPLHHTEANHTPLTCPTAIIIHSQTNNNTMVRQSTLINFCAALLCSGSATAVQNSSSRSNLRGRRLLAVSTPTTSDSLNNASDAAPRSDESQKKANKLADFASSVAAYSAAYKQAIDAAETNDDNNNNDDVVLLNEDFCSPHNTLHNHLQHSMRSHNLRAQRGSPPQQQLHCHN